MGPGRVAVEGRVYGGASPEERRAARRQQFFDAAVELIGTKGFRQLRIRDVCGTARSTDRYFYEEFGSLEGLLAHVYDQIIEEVTEATLAAVQPPDAVDLATQAQLVLAAFVSAATADRRRARIQLIEVVGVSEAFEVRRRAVMQRFSAMLAEGLRDRGLDDGSIDIDLTCAALVGAVNELLVVWINGEEERSPEQVVEVSTALFLRAFGRGA